MQESGEKKGLERPKSKEEKEAEAFRDRLDTLQQEYGKINHESENNWAFGNLIQDGGQELINLAGPDRVVEAMAKVMRETPDRKSLYSVIKEVYPDKDDRKRAIDAMLSAIQHRQVELKNGEEPRLYANGRFLHYEESQGQINAKLFSVESYKELYKYLDTINFESVLGKSARTSAENFIVAPTVGRMSLGNFRGEPDWDHLLKVLKSQNNDVALAYEVLNDESIEKTEPIARDLMEIEKKIQEAQNEQSQKTLSPLKYFLISRNLTTEENYDREAGSIMSNLSPELKAAFLEYEERIEQQFQFYESLLKRINRMKAEYKISKAMENLDKQKETPPA